MQTKAVQARGVNIAIASAELMAVVDGMAMLSSVVTEMEEWGR